jgi:hypothetical protein
VVAALQVTAPAAADADALVLLQLAARLRAAAAGRLLLILLQPHVLLLPAADPPAGAHAAEHLQFRGMCTTFNCYR